MTLLNLVGLAAAGLAVPLILLYLLKMKRQDRVVPSTVLWAKVIQDLQATHPFQKLQRNLLLILQLIILLALTLALARPAISTARAEGRSLAVIIDCSASMKARDVPEGRRFDAARKLAHQVVDSLGGDGGEIMIIASGHRTAVKVGLTHDRVALRRGLDLLAPEDARGDLNQAVVLAHAALRGRAKPELYLFTDGAGAPLEGIAGLGPVRFVRVGTTGANTAITMLDVRPAPPRQLAELKRAGKLEDGRFPYQIFVGLRNFGGAPAKGYLTLHFERDVAGAREVEVPAGGDASVVFSERFAPGLARVVYEVEDPLPEDNTAHFYLRPPREARVALLNVRTPFFERAFRSFPYVEVSRVNLDALKTQGFDLVVSEGVVPDPLPDCPFVVFGPDKPVPDVEFKGLQKFPDITDWARDHPLLRAVDFVDVHVADSMDVPQAPSGRVLVKGSGGLPLAVLSQRPGRPFRLSFGFALADSDWALRPSFPIFAWNLAQNAVEATTVVGASHFRTGAIVTLPAVGAAADVTTPSGATHKVDSPAADDPPPFTATTEAGVYTADWGGERRLRFCCNLLDEHESAIRPADELLLGGAPVAGRENVTFLHRELWPWIALAVLLVALLEWYAFHRNLGR
jgi:hypothetical protein